MHVKSTVQYRVSHRQRRTCERSSERASWIIVHSWHNDLIMGASRPHTQSQYGVTGGPCTEGSHCLARTRSILFFPFSPFFIINIGILGPPPRRYYQGSHLLFISQRFTSTRTPRCHINCSDDNDSTVRRRPIILSFPHTPAHSPGSSFATATSPRSSSTIAITRLSAPSASSAGRPTRVPERSSLALQPKAFSLWKVSGI